MSEAYGTLAGAGGNVTYKKAYINLTPLVQTYDLTTQAYDATTKQLGYSTNIIVFSIIIYTIYKLHVTKELSNDKVITSILLMTGLFENMCDMAYYIPDLTEKLGILKSNEDFLKKLVIESEDNKYQNKTDFGNSNIELITYHQRFEPIKNNKENGSIYSPEPEIIPNIKDEIPETNINELILISIILPSLDRISIIYNKYIK